MSFGFKRYIFVVFFIALSAASAVGQQVFYQHDTSVHVFAYGQQQSIPWCGGFNNPQFAMADLNNDGLNDMVVFDNWVGLRTFINKGTPGHPHYVYDPTYAPNFPPIYDFINLTDYNCDGIPDLFQRGQFGYAVYTGYYNSLNQLCFTFKQNVWCTNLFAGGPMNAYVNPGDIPSVVDVDGDGDPDLVSYDVLGRTLYYYRNMRVELGLPCDSLVFHLEDMCWGKVLQQFWRAHILGYDCDESNLILPKETKTTHTGNTPCLFDWDMDGDMDYIDGSISFPNMTFLQNGKHELGLSVDSMIYQDTLWQATTGGTSVNLTTWPAAFNVDVDQDGKKDLLIAPNAPQVSENYKCVWYYKNNSTPGVPVWEFQSDTFLVDQSIDLGTAAYPMLYDYNNDGKPDLFVGSDGYFQPSGNFIGRISYYQNTSTTWGGPSFTLVTNNFMNLDTAQFEGIAPCFGDLDNDGKTDMILGHTNGKLSFYKNVAATASATPIWQLSQKKMIDNFYMDTISVDGYSSPFVYDVDHDGLPDLVVGCVYGSFYYYKNMSTTPGVINLKLITENLGNAYADPLTTFPIYSSPYIGKIDSTGRDFLLSGSSSGNIYRWDGIAAGDTSSTYTLMDTNYSYIDTVANYYNEPEYGLYSHLRSTLTVGDIAGDGGKYMIVGNIRGGLELYALKTYFPEDTNSGPVDEVGKVRIFPNPAKNDLNIVWTGISATNVQVRIVDVEGRSIYSSVTPSTVHSIVADVSRLPDGVYICIVTAGKTRVYNKFTIVK